MYKYIHIYIYIYIYIYRALINLAPKTTSPPANVVRNWPCAPTISRSGRTWHWTTAHEEPFAHWHKSWRRKHHDQAFASYSQTAARKQRHRGSGERAGCARTHPWVILIILLLLLLVALLLSLVVVVVVALSLSLLSLSLVLWWRRVALVGFPSKRKRVPRKADGKPAEGWRFWWI